MPRFKWEPETQASWMEYMYHGAIAVRNGVAETDDPLTIDYLLRHGFVEIKDEPVEQVDEQAEDDTDAPAQARARRSKSKAKKADAAEDEDGQAAE